MQKTKLVEIIQALDDKEVKRFDEYINSPFFNKNEKVIVLLKFLRKYYPKFDHSRFYEGECLQSSFWKQAKIQCSKTEECYVAARPSY